MNPYEDDDVGSQEMVSPPSSPVVRSPGPPPSRPPGPPPPRPPMAPPARPVGPPPVTTEPEIRPSLSDLPPPPPVPSLPPHITETNDMEHVDLEETEHHSNASSPLKFQHTKMSPTERQSSADHTLSPATLQYEYAEEGLNKHGSVEIPATSNPLVHSNARKAPPPPSNNTVHTEQPSLASSDVLPNNNHADDNVKNKTQNKKASITGNVKQERGVSVKSLRTSAVKTKDNLPNLGGFNSVVKEHIEMPSEMLARQLLKDETVLASFDVLYPDSPEYPGAVNNCRPRTLTRVILCTLGLFQFCLFCCQVINFCKHLLFGCWEGCADTLQFTRGKLVVTSFGRILHWTQHVSQTPQMLEQRQYHVIDQQIESLHVDDLTQINLHYSDHYLGGCDESGGLGWCLSCCRCCRDFETGVDLLFFQYGDDASRDHSRFITPTSSQQFLSTLNAAVSGDSSAYSRKGVLGCLLGNLGLLTNRMLKRLSSNTFADYFHNNNGNNIYSLLSNNNNVREKPFRIRVVSDPRDHVCNGEYGQEPLEDVSQLQRRVTEALTNSRGQSYQSLRKTRMTDTRSSAANEENFMPVFVAASNAFGETGGTINSNNNNNNNDNNTNNPLNNNSSNGKRSSANYSVEHGGDKKKVGLIPGVKDVCDELHSFSLVDDDLQVTLPTRWLPLAEHETVLSATGQMYRPSVIDVCLSVATLGIYYIACVKPKLVERVALILTTHRLVEVSLRHRKKRVPPELGALDISIRSFLPQTVYAGYMAAGHADTVLTQDTYHITSALLTPFGGLKVLLRGTQLSFAQQLQMTTSRLDPVPISGPSHLETQFFPDPTQRVVTHQQDTDPQEDLESGHNSGSSYACHQKCRELPGKHEHHNVTASEQQLLPLLPGETLLHRHQSGALYDPHVCRSLGCSFSNDSAPLYHTQLCPLLGHMCRAPEYEADASSVRHTCSQCHPLMACLCVCEAAHCISCVSCHSKPGLVSATAILTDHTLLYTSTSHTLRSLSHSAPHNVVNSETNNGESILGETEVDWLRCFSGNVGPKTRFKLQPFLICWVPIRTVQSHMMQVHYEGAKPYATHCLCAKCCSHPASFRASYMLSVRTQSGVVLPLSDDIPFHNWTREELNDAKSNGELSKMQQTLTVMQMLSKVDAIV